MAISWTFSHNPFVKFHGEKIVSLIMLYPNRYYNEVCYAGTILYVILYDKEIHLVKQILKKSL